jgi:hypothetical protein
MDVLSRLEAEVKELKLVLLKAESKISVQNKLVIEAAQNVLEFSQDMVSFAGGLFKCGGSVAPGAVSGTGPFLNAATQNCLYCGASHSTDSFQVSP